MTGKPGRVCAVVGAFSVQSLMTRTSVWIGSMYGLVSQPVLNVNMLMVVLLKGIHGETN